MIFVFFFSMRALIRLLIIAIGLCLSAPAVLADHQGPERVIGEHVVFLSIQPRADAVQLTFFFRDTATGKALTEPIEGTVAVADGTTRQMIAADLPFSTATGRAELTTTFPRDGLYDIALVFRNQADPHHEHRPEPWDVWVPGLEKSPPPMPGLSEWLGYGLAASAAIVVGINVLQHRKRKSSV